MLRVKCGLPNEWTVDLCFIWGYPGPLTCYRIVHVCVCASVHYEGYMMSAIEGAYDTGKSTRPLGMWNPSEMALDTHMCFPVVSERVSYTRSDWVWLCGAR